MKTVKKKQKNWKAEAYEIHLYMDAGLYKIICDDAAKQDRSLTAQVRIILNTHYDYNGKVVL